MRNVTEGGMMGRYIVLRILSGYELFCRGRINNLDLYSTIVFTENCNQAVTEIHHTH